MFYDKLVGVKYGVQPVNFSDDLDKKPSSTPLEPLSSTTTTTTTITTSAAAVGSSNGISSSEPSHPSSSGTTPAADDINDHDNDDEKGKTVTSITPDAVGIGEEQSGGVVRGNAVKSEEAIEGIRPEAPMANTAGKGRDGVLRVSMRLSNEMPEFVVVKEKYEQAVRFQWRSEMHIQMAFMDQPGGDEFFPFPFFSVLFFFSLFFYCLGCSVFCVCILSLGHFSGRIRYSC